MKRAQGQTHATKRLRGFGLAVIAVLTTAGLALVGFSGAQSAADGSDSKIDFAASISSNSLGSSDVNLRAGSQFTFQAWVRPNSMAATTDHVMAVRHYDFAVVVHANTWRYYFGNNSQWSTQQNTGVAVRAGEWVHVALVQNETTSTFYIDGQAVHSSTGRTSPPASSTAKFRLGSWTDSGGVFSGLIDEVKVWVSDRTANLITDMHNRPTPGASGLRAYWDFNHGSGSLIYDRVASRNLTAITAPLYSDVKSSTAASDGDTVITFPRTYLPGVGGWTVPQNATDFRALVVAGGGAGGNTYDRPGAGGGGAGGYLEQSINELASTFTVKVGQGGQPDLPRTADPTGSGRDGQRSSLGSLEAQGGGGGGGRQREGNAGGSGGGAGGRDLSGSGNFGGNGTPGQGNSGGTVALGSNTFGPGAGGGGALGQGLGNTVSGDGPGKSGGSPRTSTLFSLTHSAGGDGGGAGQSSHKDGDAGAANTGNGGDGATSATSNSDSWGGSGGSGVVIVRYTPTIDAAVELDAASNNHLLTTSSLIPSIYTFEAWIRPTSFADYPVIYSQGSTGDSALWINNSGNPQVEWGGISAESITSYRFPLDEWTHVAVSKDGSSVPRLYINSSLIWTGAANSGSIAGQFKIGQWHANSNNNFIGEIDQVKIWNTALDATILAKSMHTYSTSGVTGTLVAHYDMNDADGSLELDRSGNGRHLTKVSILPTLYSSSNIALEGTAHTEQNYVKFNRTYLTATGGWTPPAGVTRYKALVVAGGGAGGKTIRGTYENGGGGGAGGFIETEVSTSSSVHPVKVGQGGLGSVYPPTNGENSVVFNQTAIGGGRGGSYDGAHLTGADGGSGGGGANYNNGSPGGKGTLGQGFDGAIGNHDHNNNGRGGGGGGAGSSGFEGTFDGTTFTGGAGGFGRLSSISGIAVLYAGGGGGGAGTGGAGGSGIGGAGASSTNKSGQPGASNTGSGGGGNFADGTTTVNNGGSGGSGVVILSWGPYLEVSQSPTVARAGEEFREALKLRVIDPEDGEPFTGRYPVTVTASANVLTLNGVLLTQSYTVQSSADGAVDFSGLGFASNVGGDVTLTFTSDQFVGTSVVVSPSYFPVNVEINATGVTNGTFFEGQFFASSSTGVTSIDKDALTAHIASFSTVISASGYISVNTTVTSASSSDLVLRAGGHINVTANQIIRTHGGDIVLWADSDQSAGGEVRLLGGAQLCTAPSGGTCGTATTGGGDIVIGGGFADPNDPNRPAGYAAGSGDIHADNGTATTTGVQLGNFDIPGTGPKIYSAGGDIAIRGAVTSVSTTNYRAGIAVVGGTVIRSGEGKIFLSGDASNNYAHNTDRASGTIEFNAWGSRAGVNVEITSLSTDPEAIVIEGIEGNVRTRNGVWGSNDDTEIVSAGGFIIRANQIDSNLDLHLSVSGQVVIEPHTTSLRNTSDLDSAFTSPLRNTNVDDKLWLRSPPTGIRIGSSSNSNQVILDSPLTSAGDIDVIAGSISLQAAQDVTSQSARVTLKSKGDIITTAAGGITTDGGAIVLWSNADGDSATGGRIGVVAGTSLTSNGGDIVLAGGSGSDSSGYPTGYVRSATAASSLRFAGSMDSGGGDIILRGALPSATGNNSIAGIYLEPRSSLSSGAGAISVSGVAPADVVNTGNQWPVWLGNSGGGVSITSSTGDIQISGDASSNSSLTKAGGVVTYQGSITSQTGNIVLVGKSGTNYDPAGLVVDISGWSSYDMTVSTSGNVNISTRQGGTLDSRGLNVVNAGNLLIETDNLRTVTTDSSFKASRIEVRQAPKSTPGTANLSLGELFVIEPETSDVIIGSSSVGSVTINSNISVSGNVEVAGNAVSLSQNVFAGGSNPAITISADVIDVDNVSSIKAIGGDITLLANTAGRGIILGGTTTSALLEISDTELNRFFATNLRVGDSSTANIYIAGDIALSAQKVTNLIIRAAGNVLAQSGGKITAANLGIQADGIIDLVGGNAVSGNVALNGSGGVSYSSAVSYSPATVSGLTPVFGVGVAVSQTNSPPVEQRNAFLAVTFNPPPQFVVTDSYSNTLDGNNRLVASYTVSATANSTGTVGTVTGLTASFSAGAYSFNSLRVDSNPGTYSFAVTVNDGAGGFTTTSVDYNVQSGDPQQLIVTANDTSAPSGQASFSYVVSVQDQGGNKIVAGTNKNITVSASVSGGVLVSGGQVQANDSGVAVFTDLVITGSVSDQISISFFVEFTNNENVFTTVSSEVSAVTLIPGTATQLRIDDPSQSVANRNTMSALLIDLLDAQGNIVSDRTDEISVSITSGSNATLVGTTALNFTAGASSQARLSFDDLALQGTAGSYRLDIESDLAGIASVSHDVTLTFGSPSELAITQGAAQIRSGIQIVTQPRLALLDLDGNLVPSDASVSATVQGATFGGSAVIEMVDGLATYSDLVLTGTAGSYTISYSISAPVQLAALSTSEQVSMTAGAPAKLRVAQQPGDVVAGVGQAVSVSVQVLDAQDNLTTVTAPTAINLSLQNYAAGAAIVETTSPITLAPGNSTLTYSNLVLTKAGPTMRLQFTASGLAAATSNFFSITANAPHHLDWVTNVSDVANDVSMGPAPTLRVFDAFDNPVVAASAQTSISVSVIVGGAKVLDVSGGNAETDSSSSLVSLDNLVLRAKVGSYQLRITALNSDQPIDGFTIDSDNFDVDFGVAVSLTTSPTALSAVNRATLAEITVSVLDTAENLVADNTQSITPSVSGIALTGTAVSAVGGQATFSSLVLTGLVGSYDLGFSAAAVTGATTSVTVSHAAPFALSFSAPATAQNAATTSELVAQLLDQDGNRVVSGDQSEQTVELVVGGAALTGNVRVSASAGIATFSNVAITGSIGDKVITATILDPSEITASETVSLSFGVAAKLAITTPAAGFVNRTNFTTQPSVTVQDISGNTVEDFSGSVTLNIGSGASFNYEEPAGVEAARLASCTPSVSGGLQYTVALVGSDCVISFTSGSGSWTPSFDGSVQLLAVAGGGGGGAGRGEDVFPGGGGGAGELVFSSSRNVSLAAISIQIGQGGANAVGDFQNGGSGENTTFGNTTLRGGGFGSGANTGDGAGSGGSGGGGNGFGNKAPGSSIATVGFGFSGGGGGSGAAGGGGGAGGPGLGPIGQQGGAGGPGLEFDISGELVTYAAGGKGGSHNLAGQGRPTSNFTVGGGGGGRAGYNSESTAGQPGIVIVRFPSSIPGAVNVNSQGGVSVTPVGGVATFTNLGLRGTVGDYTITASATSLVFDSQDVTLTHGAATQLEVTSPANVINDTSFSSQPSLRLVDADGNLVSTSASASGQVIVSYSGNDWTTNGTGVDLGGTTTLTLNQGQGSFSDLRLSGKVGSYTLTYSYQPDPSISISEAVTVEPGTESSIAIVQQPQNVIAGVAFASDVVVEILDAYQNRVIRLTESATVRARLINSSDSAFIALSSAVGSQQGLVTFSALTFTSAGDRKIVFESALGSSASALAATTSAQFTITHAAASTLSWVVVPQGTVMNDATIVGVGAAAPQIRAFDEFGNLANTGTVSIEVVSVGSNTPQAIAGAEVDGVTGTITLTQLSLRALVGLYDLEFRATTDTNASVLATLSHQVQVLHGVPNQVTTSAHATAARAGINFMPQPVVEILDSAGNLVSNSGLVVYATVAGATLVGSGELAATNGVSSFSGLQLTGSASSAVTLSYEISYQSSSISTSVVIPLLAGDTAMAALSWTVTDVQTRVAPQNDPVVELFDSFGNKAFSDSSSTAVARLYRAGALVTQSPTTFTAASGDISFAGLALKATPGSNYSYEFDVGGLAPVTSPNFSMLPGPVAKVVIHQQPRTGAAGVTTTMTGELFEDDAVVRLFDMDDNLVHTVDSGVITAAISSGTGGSLISASASINKGTARFDELRLVGVVKTPDQDAQQYKLTFSYDGFDSSESNEIEVKHNLATQLFLVQDAAGGRASSIFTTAPKVRLLDRYNNWVSTGTSVTVQADVIDENGGSPSLVGGDAQTTNGEATLAVGISGTTATTYTLRFVATSNQGVPIASAEQTGIVITHGSASRVRILQNLASDDGAGNLTKTGSALNVQPVVEVVDANNNRVLDFAGIVQASISSVVRAERDYLIGNTVSAVAGVATFSALAMVGEVGTSYSLNFYRQGFLSNPALSANFVLTHGDAEYLTIATQPAGGNKTGSALSQSPIIEVRDFDGNLAQTLNNTNITAAIFSGTGSVDVTGSNTDKAVVINGVAQFSNLTVVALPGESQSLLFTLDGATNSASGLVTSSESVTFSLVVSDAFQLSVILEPCTASDCSAGPTAELLGVQPIVEVQDRFGNRVPSFVGSVTATLQGTGGSLRDASAQISARSVEVVDGLATFTDLRIEGVPGNNYGLQFATSGLQSTTSQDIQVIHTTPSQLVIIEQPVGGITGAELATQPIVEVRDRFGNLAVTDSATEVTISVFSGPERESDLAAVISGSKAVTAVNGVATFASLELFAKSGANYVLNFGSDNFAVNSNGVVVSPASANSLQWVVEPVAQRTGEVMGTQPVLRMLDFDGNIASSTSATVLATVSSGGGYIEAGTSSAAVDGLISFAGLTLVAAPNADQTLTFTATTADGSFSITTTAPLNVQHTAASQMLIDQSYATSNEQGVVLGTQPVLKLYDRFMNLAVNDNQTVVSAAIGTGAAVSASATATAVAGVVTFAGLAVTGSPGVDYTLDFATSGYGVAGTAQLKLFKTAALEVSYSNIVFSSSPTTMPAIAYTDSTHHSISYSVSTTDICTINATSGEVTIVGAGTCVIRVEVADGTFYKATGKDVTLTIQKAQQDPVVISSQSWVNFGDVLTLTDSGGSSTATTRFFATGECQILGDKLMTHGNATEGGQAACTILASRPGDANYLSSATEWMEIEVRRIAQHPISIGNSRNVSVGNVNLFTFGGSGNGAVSYSVQIGTNNAVCSVVDGVLTSERNGSCEVSAQKGLSANYNTASSTVAVFTFTKQLQQVEITSAPPAMPLPGQSYQLVATASSGLAISYAVTKGQEIQETSQQSASAAVCTLSQSVSGQVTFLRSGECEVTATVPSSDRYASANAKIAILVGQRNQFITFEALSNRIYGSPSFRLDAVASSGLPVSFNVSSGASACSISNGRLTIEAAGMCEITASQGGNGSFAPAPNVIRSFVVSADIASAPSLLSAAVGNQWFTVGFSSPSYTGGSPVIAYRLEVRDPNDNLYVTTTTDTASPLSITAVGLPNSVSYTARVAAITSAGLGKFSNTSVQLSPSEAAMSVTQLSADTSNTGLDLSWVAPMAIKGNFLRYEVYAWVTGTEEPVAPSATVTDMASNEVSVEISSISDNVDVSPAYFTAPRLEIVQPLFRPNGGVYIFGAIAHQPMGFIALSSIASPATSSATVGYTMMVVTITDEASSSQVINTANGVKVGLSTPSAPTQLDLDSSDASKITITWAAPNSDGGFPLIDYQVTSNGAVICANIQVRMCEVSPLALSTTYNIEVKASNALGHGEAAAGSHTTPAPEPVITVQSQGSLERVTLGPIPQMVNFVPNVVRPGAMVSVTGERFNTLETISIGGIQVEFAVQDAGALMFRIPIDMPSGRYSVIHTSTFGKVTVMDAITVLEMPVQQENEPAEAPETEVPLNTESVKPEVPVSPESGSQAPDSGGGPSEGSGASAEQPVEPESPATSEPEPSPAQKHKTETAKPDSEEEVIAATPRDQAQVLGFGLSFAFIIAILLVLFVLRQRRE